MDIKSFINKVDKRKFHNNLQRVMFSLLKREGGWLARTTLKVPNVGARLRDLRKDKFGNFNVECKSAKQLKKVKRVHKSKLTAHQTFYRLDLGSVSEDKLNRLFRNTFK